MVAISLRQHGCAVWLAADGWEALDVYRDRREAVDVVLMDVRMPGLDGPRTLAELRQLDPKVRCCFMSGDLGDYTERELHELGATAVFLKPLHLDEVFLALSEIAVNTPTSPPGRR